MCKTRAIKSYHSHAFKHHYKRDHFRGFLVTCSSHILPWGQVITLQLSLIYQKLLMKRSCLFQSPIKVSWKVRNLNQFKWKQIPIRSRSLQLKQHQTVDNKIVAYSFLLIFFFVCLRNQNIITEWKTFLGQTRWILVNRAISEKSLKQWKAINSLGRW